MAEKNKTLVIKSKSSMPLKVFEAADSTQKNKKYIFQGVFTACSTPEHTVVNRNGRVYTAQECLRHLAYLRENIRRDGFILGELDHPIDRFDTQLKEASHKITDLWYDQNTACIMGKIEVLDTPNGKIARQLIDSGYPVFVSSRAAGEVDPKSKEVHIEQIFTYDIVCTPGFAEARLERVNESYRSSVKKYLNESAVLQEETAAETKKLGVLLEGVSVCEFKGEVALSARAKELMEKEINMDELSKPVGENKKNSILEDESFQLPMTDLNPATANDEVKEADGDVQDKPAEEKSADEEKKEDGDKNEEKKTLTDDEKAANRAKILSVEAIDADGKSSDEDAKEEKRDEILDVEGIEATDDDVFEEPKEEPSEEDKTDECNANADTQETGDDVKAAVKDADNSDDPRDIKTKNAGVDAIDAKKRLNDCNKQDDIKKQTEDDMDKIQKLLAKAKKVADVKESIVKEFPFTVAMSSENFGKFAALNPIQKKKVALFINEHAMFDAASINANWATPLLEERRLLKNWLRLATDEDRKLFSAAPKEVQDAIEESAKYVMIRTQAEAERFWENTGLRRQNADRILQQSINESYAIGSKTAKNRDIVSDEAAKSLGYSYNYMKMMEDYFDNN